MNELRDLTTLVRAAMPPLAVETVGAQRVQAAALRSWAQGRDTATD